LENAGSTVVCKVSAHLKTRYHQVTGARKHLFHVIDLGFHSSLYMYSLVYIRVYFNYLDIISRTSVGHAQIASLQITFGIITFPRHMYSCKPTNGASPHSGIFACPTEGYAEDTE